MEPSNVDLHSYLVIKIRDTDIFILPSISCRSGAPVLAPFGWEGPREATFMMVPHMLRGRLPPVQGLDSKPQYAANARLVNQCHTYDAHGVDG